MVGCVPETPGVVTALETGAAAAGVEVVGAVGLLLKLILGVPGKIVLAADAAI